MRQHPVLKHVIGPVVALAAVGVATAITTVLWPYNSRVPFAVYYLAVLVSSIQGGTRAGILSTLLSLGTVNYCFLAPFDSFSTDAQSLVSLCISGIVCGLIIAIIRQRQKHEAEIERLNRLYDALKHVNQVVVRSTSRQELLQAVCNALIEKGGLSMAWIGWNDEQQHKLLPVAVAGENTDYVHKVVIKTDGSQLAQGPSGKAFLSNTPCICNDFMGDPATLPWHEQAKQNHIAASAALPIQLRGRAAGILNVYAHVKHYFRDKELALLTEVTADLSFALDGLDRDQQRQQAEAMAAHEQSFSNAMIDSMPGILYFYDQHGRFLRWNQNFSSVSGYSDAEIANMHPLDFFADADKALLTQRIGEVMHKGESWVEADFLSKDGRATPYIFTGKRITFNGEPCLIGVGMDISERKQVELALEDYTRRLQATSRQLLEVQENERRLLARDLHDSVGQELTALSLNLSIIHASLPKDLASTITARLDDSRKLLEDTTQHLRSVMIELRPPGLDELGLLSALKEHAQRVAQRSGFALQLGGAEPQPRLSPTMAIALFRIAQEALNNTVKHAQASAIQINLQQHQGLVTLVVADNGRGFDTNNPSPTAPFRMGMTTMRERAQAIGASLRLDTAPGQGTRITIEIPQPV